MRFTHGGHTTVRPYTLHNIMKATLVSHKSIKHGKTRRQARSFIHLIIYYMP